ncbi:MAG: hypothetical protein IJD16_04730 [Desulfovibrio sp.]|nr:hypothetical protein [Desulfovibrio sp.]
MRKALSIFLLFLVVVTVLIPCVLLAAESAEAVPGADLAAVVLGYLPASWDGWVTLVVTLCAALSSMWSRPPDNANVVIRLLYTIVNAIGFNMGKARNADDQAARAAKL